MSQNQKAEVVVIGAGPAGYVCAIRLAQLGKKVVCIEKGELGGVCLNVGCIPSKALIYAGSLFEKMGHADEMGISVSGAKIDLKKTMAWKEGVVKKLTGGVGTLFKANGVKHIKGEAKFASQKSLWIKEDKEEYELEFEDCVVATGSRPTEIPGFKVDNKNILDSTGALAQTNAPKTMLCVGGGYIGLELGTFYAKVGTKVTVVEAAPQLLGIVDKDLVRVVEKGLKKRNVEILTNTKVKSSKSSTKGVEVSFEDGSKKTYEKVLVTVGRTPNSENLALDKAGLVTDSKGFLEVDTYRRTRIKNIYAIGDLAGQPLLAHKGSKEGIIAAEVIAGKKSAYDVVAMPAVIFTDPEVATVGLTEAEAKSSGLSVDVGTFPFAANGRALSVGEPEGMVKTIADQNNGRLLGVHMVGPEASNLIAEAALALEMGASVEDLAMTVHAHPTLPEAVMESAESALGHAIHVYQKKARSKPSAPEASANA